MGKITRFQTGILSILGFIACVIITWSSVALFFAVSSEPQFSAETTAQAASFATPVRISQPISTLLPTKMPGSMTTSTPIATSTPTALSSQNVGQTIGEATKEVLFKPTAIIGVGAFPLGPTATPPGEDITGPNYLKGKVAYEAKNYEDVLILMAQVLQTDPNLAPPYWYRGMAYFHLQDYHSGLVEMERALAIDPEYALAYADRGSMYDNLGNEEQAFLDWNKALSLDPSLAKVHHNMALTYFDHGDFYRALEEFDLALAIDPGRASSWVHRAAVFLNLGKWKYQECIDGVSHGLEIQPDIWIGYYIRGICYARLRKFETAVTDFTQYVEAVPNDPDGWYNRGLANHNIVNNVKAHRQALADYSRAIELDPTFTSALINRGDLYLSIIGDAELALIDYNTVLISEKIPRAYVGRGDAYFLLQRYDEALADYQRALELHPSYNEAHIGVSRSATEIAKDYIIQKDYQQAITMSNLAIEATQNTTGYVNSMPLHILGRAYYGLGDNILAITYLSQAMKSFGRLSDYYYRALAFEANGQIKDAVRDYQFVVDHANNINDDDPAIIEASRAKLTELK